MRYNRTSYNLKDKYLLVTINVYFLNEVINLTNQKDFNSKIIQKYQDSEILKFVINQDSYFENFLGSLEE